ncbi:MAG: ABC transporter permease [Candidatus Acidiferrales bacterium]
MRTFWQDVRYGIRVLRNSPGLTAVIVLTLALGIGANTAIFSIVNQFLFKPLPVREPSQLTVIASSPKETPLLFQMSYPALQDLRKQTSEFSDIFAYQIGVGGLSVDGQADQFVYTFVSNNYFSTLGLKPAAGRLLLTNEGETPGEPPLVVLGYSYWQRRFGGDAGIIGKQVLLNGKPATIVGVTPKDFLGTAFIFESQGYVPLSMMGAEAGSEKFWTDRSSHGLRVMGRLKPGVSVAQAQSSVQLVAARLAEQFPETDRGYNVRVIPETFARPQPYPTNIVPVIAGVFLILAALVLLLACMNVANVLLSRAMARQREMAVRAALGATRSRLIRQTLTETLLLSLLGGAVGIFLGIWVSSLNSIHVIAGIPINLEFAFDGRVFAYAMAAAVFTGLVAGAWPAWRASRADVSTVLHEGGRGGSGGVARQRIRSVLVTAQVAGSLMLLIVTGLFVRNVQNVQKMDLGFQPEGLLNVTMDPHEIGYDSTRTKEFYRQLEERAGALPGVESVAMAYSVPMGNYMDGSPVYLEGHPLPPGSQAPQMVFNRVTPTYFETMKTPILRGRGFTKADDEHAPAVAIVNETMAQKFWPNEDPVGKRFSAVAEAGPFIQVVGETGKGKYIFIGESPMPAYYVPMAQDSSSIRVLEIRSAGDPAALIPEVQQKIHDLAPDLPIFSAITMKQSLGGANGFFIFRRGAELGAMMGILGTILAVVGVYGVVSFAASQRTREIGIRMALGAGPNEILAMMIRQGLGLVLGGVAAGLAAAWLLTRGMGNLLVGVSASDPLTFISSTILLAGVAVLACWIPARRAAGLDPLDALRYE